MNAALYPPTSAGTSPHDEITSRHTDDHGQRDDREATTSPEDMRAHVPTQQLPDGFRWMPKYQNGRPVMERGRPVMVVKPTTENIRDLTALVTDFFEARELRTDEVGEDEEMKALLDKIAENLGRANQFLGGSGPAYSLAGGYAQQLANAVRWVDIHAMMLSRHQDNGNEDAAERSLANLESSRTQALKVASLLDWCEDAGATINIEWGVIQALNLAAWQVENSDRGAQRRAVHQTTRDHLFNTHTSTPEESAEADEDNIDY